MLGLRTDGFYRLEFRLRAAGNTNTSNFTIYLPMLLGTSLQDQPKEVEIG
jgi:hypothetical protein